jgi:hypothetical protein
LQEFSLVYNVLPALEIFASHSFSMTPLPAPGARR